MRPFLTFFSILLLALNAHAGAKKPDQSEWVRYNFPSETEDSLNRWLDQNFRRPEPGRKKPKKEKFVPFFEDSRLVFHPKYLKQTNPLATWTQVSDPRWKESNPEGEGLGLDYRSLAAFESQTAALLTRLSACASGDVEKMRTLYFDGAQACAGDSALHADLVTLHQTFFQFMDSTLIENALVNKAIDTDTLDRVKLPRANPLFQQIVLEAVARYGLISGLDIRRGSGEGDELKLPEELVAKFPEAFPTRSRFIDINYINPARLMNPENPQYPMFSYNLQLIGVQVAPELKPAVKAAQEYFLTRVRQTQNSLYLTVRLIQAHEPGTWGFWPATASGVYWGLSLDSMHWTGNYANNYAKGSLGYAFKWLFFEIEKHQDFARMEPTAYQLHPEAVTSLIRDLSERYAK